MANSVGLNTSIYDFDNNVAYTKDFIDKLSNENKLYIEIYYYQSNNQGKYHEPAEGRRKVYAIIDVNNPSVHIPVNKEAFDYARKKGSVLLELTPDQANYRHDELQGIFKMSEEERKAFEIKTMYKFYDIFGFDSNKDIFPKLSDEQNDNRKHFKKQITITDKDWEAIYQIHKYYEHEQPYNRGNSLELLHKEVLETYGNQKTAFERFSVLDDLYNSQQGRKYINDTLESAEHIPKETLLTIYEDHYEKYVNRSLKSPAQADENIISKENRMSDLNEQEGETRDPKEEAFLNALHHRKVITDAMKAGNLCCLPGSDGYADTTPAINVASGTFYHGANMMFLKEHTRENAYPSAEYITSKQLEKIREKNSDFIIRKGEKGVSIYVSEKIEGTENEWSDPKSIRLFNVAQTNKPSVLKDYLVKEKEAYLQTQYGANYTYEPNQKKPGVDIICSSTDPVQYIGQYLAAVSMGSKFQVTKEQAAEFSKNMESTLYAKMDNGHTNPFALSKISNDASTVCKEVIKEAKMAAQKLEQPQQQQQQSRGHKM